MTAEVQLMRYLSTVIIILLLAACSSGWSDAELRSVESYCATRAAEFNSSCESWIDGISRLSDCDPDQAKRVIDRIIEEYAGAVPALSIAEHYERVGCAYGER